MKIPKDAYNKEQLEALSKNGVVFDFGKDYSDGEIADIEGKIGNMVMDNASYLDDIPNNRRVFWESLIDIFVKLQDTD